jgi:hypothetical protein
MHAHYLHMTEQQLLMYYCTVQPYNQVIAAATSIMNCMKCISFMFYPGKLQGLARNVFECKYSKSKHWTKNDDAIAILGIC